MAYLLKVESLSIYTTCTAYEIEYMKNIDRKELLGILFVSLLPIFVFWGYLVGQTAPPWDFFGDYYTQAYSWWDLGSFFKPTTYLPYLVSGFPSHLGLQVSSYYLPVGLIAEFGEYTILNAARLQAVTVSFGIIGVFLLAKKFELDLLPRFIVSIGYFFTAGFFSNASHIDIVRAWSFFPWLLLFLFPIYKNKYIILPFISLAWFQFFVGAYPGNLASFAYLFFLFSTILVTVFKIKFIDLAKWYSLTLVPGILLSSIKWIPFLTSGNGPVIGNQVKVNLGIFSTIFFPYGGTGQSGDVFLPNDLTQRTFFIIPLVFMLAFFAYKNKKIIITGLGFVLFSIILGIDFVNIPKWQEYLPLLEISRFRTIDFKPGISFGIALLAGSGLQNLMKFNLFNSNVKEKVQIIFKLFLAYASALIVLLIGKSYDFTQPDNKFTLNLVAFSSVLIFFLIITNKKLKIFVSFLIVISSIYLGLSWANYFKDPWQVPRAGTENLYFGLEVSEIIKSKEPIRMSYREKRVGPNLPIPYPGEMIIQFWNSNEIKRTYSTGGYVTIKGEPNFDKYVQYALDNDYSKVIDFLSQESRILFVDEKEKDIDKCLAFNLCNLENIKYKFISYSPGELIVTMDPLSKNYKLIVNEIGWRGWVAESCDKNEMCQQIKVGNQEENLLLNANLPKGTSKLTFKFETPYLKISWYIFYTTILVLLIYVFTMIFKKHRS